MKYESFIFYIKRYNYKLFLSYQTNLPCSQKYFGNAIRFLVEVIVHKINYNVAKDKEKHA